MIHFLYGEAGTGKSTTVAEKILADLKEGRRALLLVPEQETVAAETRISELTESENIPTDRLEVLSFRRLANRIFREYGLLSYHYVGKGAKALIMWMTIDEVNSLLTEYRSARDGIRQMVPLMLKAVDDFRAYRITPENLENAAEKVRPENPRFAGRLHDLALVYGTYRSKLKNSYEDPKDDLDNLVTLLDEYPDALREYSVYIDSFHGFTEQEFAVIRRLFRDAERVTLTLGFNPSSKSPAYDGISKTASDLTRFAESTGKTVTKEILIGAKRFKSKELSFLSEKLWSFDKTEIMEGKPSDVSVMKAADRYAESEAVAQKIAGLVRKGVRYREIAVIVRDTELYEGILDAYLEKYGIPYFLSVREPLTSKPLIRLILSALAIRADSWRADDVIGYLKTGLTGIKAGEIDRFETYVNRWAIRGRRFWDENDWTMNPDGYSKTVSEKAARTLDRINLIRKQITEPLNAFFECFEAESTVKSVSAALYNFLVRLNIPRKCRTEEEVRVFNAVCDALDQLVAVMPLTQVTADLYLKLFTMLIAEADIGNIPKGSDCVTVGSSATVRNDGIRYVFLMGVNEGIFPAAIAEDPLFTDSEKLLLENECELSMPPDTARLESEELYGFLRSVSCASEGVAFSYPVSDPSGKALKPSLAVYRTKALFKDLKEEAEESRPVAERIFDSKSSFETAVRFRNAPEGKALFSLYAEDESFSQRAEALKMPITDPNASVSEETVKKFYRDEVVLSKSSLESYNNCPFSFWGNYPLSLDDKAPYTFDFADTGILVHHVLETFLREMQKEYNGLNKIPSDEKTKKNANEKLKTILDDYYNAVFGSANAGRTPGSYQFLFDRVRRTSRKVLNRLLEEFSVSKFQPAFYELRIGTPRTNANSAPDNKEEEKVFIPSPDLKTENGIPIILNGYIDRVDTWKPEAGNDVYVRVIDYKTGQKSFNKNELEVGKYVQMPLYLFSICDSGDKKVSSLFGAGEGGKLIPTGFLYYNALLTKPKPGKLYSELDPEDAANQSFSCKGLLTNNMDILEAMEPGLQKRFIPAKKTDKGALNKKVSAVASDAEFSEIKDTVQRVIVRTADDILAGKADVAPRFEKNPNENVCKYCSLKPVCRRVRKTSADEEEGDGNE